MTAALVSVWPDGRYNAAFWVGSGAVLKHCLIILAVVALAACANLEQDQLALEGLRAEVRDLAVELGAVERSVQGVSGRVQGLEAAVSTRLDSIDGQLAKPVSLPTVVCEMPEAPVAELQAQACEAPVEVVPEGGTDKMVVGSLEEIRITPPGIAVTVRIDTGADSNSLSATNLVFLERDGDDWVRFDLQARDGTHTLEREVRRYVRVFQQSDTAGARRPVVLLRVQLGDILGNFEFSLSDRTHLKHAVILGRSLLMDLILVDVSQQFLQPLPDGEG